VADRQQRHARPCTRSAPCRSGGIRAAHRRPRTTSGKGPGSRGRVTAGRCMLHFQTAASCPDAGTGRCTGTQTKTNTQQPPLLPLDPEVRPPSDSGHGVQIQANGRGPNGCASLSSVEPKTPSMSLGSSSRQCPGIGTPGFDQSTVHWSGARSRLRRPACRRTPAAGRARRPAAGSRAAAAV
jgi:hypothetical protein